MHQAKIERAWHRTFLASAGRGELAFFCAGAGLAW